MGPFLFIKLDDIHIYSLEILKIVIMEVIVFWPVTPFSLADTNFLKMKVASIFGIK